MDSYFLRKESRSRQPAWMSAEFLLFFRPSLQWLISVEELPGGKVFF
jgi:hypothetical protein